MTYHDALQKLNDAAHAVLRKAVRLDHPDTKTLRRIALETDELTGPRRPTVPA